MEVLTHVKGMAVRYVRVVRSRWSDRDGGRATAQPEPVLKSGVDPRRALDLLSADPDAIYDRAERMRHID